MYRTVLVPLDGSPIAEQAVPLALAIARRTQANLRLARVHNPPTSVSDYENAKSIARTEQAYLDSVAFRILERDKLCVKTALLEGPIANALSAHAKEVHASVIVLTTHGRGPMSRFWLGSTTDDLIRLTPAPLLVYRPTSEKPPPADLDVRFRKILVPLDGSDVAEEALGPAAEMARIMGASLTLLRIVEPVPLVAPDGLVYSPPTLDASVIDDLTKHARAYVDHVAARWQGEGLKVETKVVVNDIPVAVILESAERHDLIALATHGRSRVARFFLGSVADKLVRGAPCPVLLVRHPHTRPEGGRP